MSEFVTMARYSTTAMPGEFPVDPTAMCPECGKRWSVEHVPALMDAEGRTEAALWCDTKWAGCGKPFYILRVPAALPSSPPAQDAHE